MWKTVARRLLILIPQLFALSICIFILAQFMPGDPLTGLIGEVYDIDEDRIRELRILHGLYDPWYVQYFRWLGNALRGDFGVSMVYHISVLTVVGERIWNTIWLSLFSTILLYAISVPLGIIAGRYNNTWKERIISGYLYFGMAMPTIVFAFILMWVFGFLLGWFPMGGTWSVEVAARGFWPMVGSRIYHMILPAAAIGLFGSVGIVQYLRGEIVDAKVSDYVLTARSKGVPMNVIYNKHILRNSILPIASNFGYVIVGLLSGAVFTETVFGFNGMGRLFIASMNSRDFSVINFLVMFYGATGVLGGLIGDIALTVFDPRIRIK